MSSSAFSFASPYATTFSELLSAGGDTAVEELSRCNRNRGRGIPKFKSTPPPSLPLSPPPNPPASYFSIPTGLSPAELLGSSVLLPSNNRILSSPTTGTFPSRSLNWIENSISKNYYEGKRDENRAHSGFSFETRTKPSSLLQQLPVFKGSQAWNLHENNNKIAPSALISEAVNSSREKPLSGDGYNWRKYGQKQVKGSENPRSYYKCTYPNCTTKKKVEKNFNGEITEIVYRGSHNHPEPQPTRRNSSSSQSLQQMKASSALSEASEHSDGGWSKKPMDSVTTPEISSASLDEEEADMSSQWSNLTGGELEEDPQAKRWSYYKCTTIGCPVRKHIERAPHDTRSVITTYEGKHRHDVPAARATQQTGQHRC